MFKKFSSLNENAPISVPSYIGKSMVEQLQKLPQSSNHWVRYKAVIRKQPAKPNTYDIRIYDEWETEKKGAKVTNYNFFDSYPDLIQFTGWFEPQTKMVEIKYVQAAGKAA
jgi:hypothetical protein